MPWGGGFKMLTQLYQKPVLIFGCGNILFGDDGFGPAVVEQLQQHFPLPEHVLALDVGTSVRELLFDLLLAGIGPKQLFIVDAVSQSARHPGEIFEIEVQQVPAAKAHDFSLHQFPSVNLLQELRDLAAVDIRVLAVQVRNLPEEVRPGLSDEVKAAVPAACTWLLQQIEGIA